VQSPWLPGRYFDQLRPFASRKCKITTNFLVLCTNPTKCAHVSGGNVGSEDSGFYQFDAGKKVECRGRKVEARWAMTRRLPVVEEVKSVMHRILERQREQLVQLSERSSESDLL
jgi:hypothetical protein